MIIPILKIRSTLIASFHRHLEDDEVAKSEAEVLEALHRTEAHTVVVELSTLDIIDSYMARVLACLAASCQLMGARVIFCGIQPEVAITLVEMGRDLGQVETALDLDQALERSAEESNRA